MKDINVAELNEKLDYYLSILGLTKEEFDESIKNMPNVTNKAFLSDSDYERHFASYLHKEYSDIALSASLREYIKHINFYVILEPFVLQSIDQVNRNLELHSIEGYDIASFTEAIKGLLNNLYKMSYRTLVLELNVARLSNQLVGETSEERLKYYQSLLKNKDYTLPFFQEYKSLFKLLYDYSLKWVNQITNIITRYTHDYEMLKEAFASKLGPVRDIHYGMGDTHNDGQSVSIVELEEMRIVYKPRPLEAEKVFQLLIEFFNKYSSNKQHLKTIKVLDRVKYGWSEFVASKPCSSDEEVNRYYYNLGVQLAILHSLNAVDIHAENLIACKEHPILIDLESIFHNIPDILEGDSSLQKATDLLRFSVRRTGLIPLLFTYKKNDKTIKGIDVSGIGDLTSQETPVKIPVIENNNSDNMHIVMKHLTFSGADNTPQVGETKVNPLHYLDFLKSGFTESYQTIQCNKTVYLQIVENLFNVKLRHILRPTMRYSNLLRYSYHPDFLRNDMERELLFHKLWQDTKGSPRLKRTSLYEKQSLLKNDVPYFFSRPNSTSIFTPDKEFEGFFTTTSMEQVINKIHGLSKADLKFQLQVIELSMTALKDTTPKQPIPIKSVPGGITNRKVLLEQAIKIGDYLIDESIQASGEKDIAWLIARPLNIQEDQWSVDVSGPDLYDGLPGIALFFAYLGQYSQNELYKKIALRCLHPMLRQIENFGNSKNSRIGVFTGISGYIFVLTELSKLWDDQSLLPYIEWCVNELELRYEADDTFDIIGGGAGAILVLTNKSHQGKYIPLAERIGQKVLSEAVHESSGIGWLGVSSRPLSGFSHGNAGIALALYQLYKATNNKIFEIGAEKALRYERTLFKNNNWLDRRDIVDQEYESPAAAAWCHGAPGILLSRIKLKQLGYQDAFIDSEIENAIRITQHSGFGRDHSLCHGDLGNAEILFLTSLLDKKTDILDSYHSVINNTIQEINSTGWKTGISKNFIHPGLMTGISGIGYGLLRAFDPKGVPSILSL